MRKRSKATAEAAFSGGPAGAWVVHPNVVATREIAGHKNIPPRMQPWGRVGTHPLIGHLVVQYRRRSVVIFCKTVSRETAKAAREIIPLGASRGDDMSGCCAMGHGD